MLEPDEGKLSSPVLRGPAPSNGGWPLGKNVKGLTCWTRFGVVAGELLILPVAGASNIVTFCHPGDSPIELVVADFKRIRARYHFGEGQHTQTSGK